MPELPEAITQACNWAREVAWPAISQNWAVMAIIAATAMGVEAADARISKRRWAIAVASTAIATSVWLFAQAVRPVGEWATIFTLLVGVIISGAFLKTAKK